MKMQSRDLIKKLEKLALKTALHKISQDQQG